MKFSNLSLLSTVLAGHLVPSEQAGLRELKTDRSEPDCTSVETGFSSFVNAESYQNPTSAKPKKDATYTSFTPNIFRGSKVIKSKKSKKSKKSSKGSDPSNQDDVFVYPESLPPPPEMFIEGFIIRLVPFITSYETPIQLWLTHRIDETLWNCIAHYHPTALNVITQEDPAIRTPEEFHTSEARALCMTYALNKLVPEILPSAAGSFSAFVVEAGLDPSIITDEVAINAATIEKDPSPIVIGSLVAAEMLQYIETDGWNYKGALKSGNKSCTANCRPFADTVGYVPKNSPWHITDPIAWQPLIESDDHGFYSTQEHVTPHIGFNAKPVVLTREEIDATQIEDPNYDYEEETLKVIENVANLTDTKKALIHFFDSKLNIVAGLLMRLRGMYHMSLEAQVFFALGYTASEYDAVILAWKEKVRHDRIRPTSLVQALGEDFEVESFAGTHSAEDWVPFIRVMPHAEYPSGSGCLCTALAQYTDAFLSDQYDTESLATSWDFGGIIVNFSNLTELATNCGESRLWGGMHFTASVPNSYDLCDGVGTKAYSDLMITLLGEGSYDELMDETKPKYNGPIFTSFNN